MPSKRYGTATATYEQNGNYMVHVTGRVTAVPLLLLNRLDLMALSGAIAKSKGEKSGGTRWTNDQMKRYIKDNTPWTAETKGAEPVPAAEKGDKVPTNVTCSCGHDYTFRIDQSRGEATKKWLESKPCPSCQRKQSVPQQQGAGNGDTGEKHTPESQEGERPEDKVAETVAEVATKADLGDIDLDTLADKLVGKVMARMQPVVMPPLHHEVLPEVVKLLKADVPTWLQGPPGTSKSTIAAQAAEALGLPLHAISCHEAMTRSDMFGYTDANGTDHRSPLWEAYENGGVLLLDEIDNGNANILAALNSALSNGFTTFAGKTVHKHKDFKVVSTANTAGMGPESGFIGRMGVDLATLDRFVTLQVNIDEKLEEAIVRTFLEEDADAVLTAVRALRVGVEKRGLRMMVSPRTSIHAAKMVREGVDLAEALRRTALRAVDSVTQGALLAEAGL
jgi:MoxR-like ATPase